MNDFTRSRFLLAIEKFNNREYFDCHEILEDIWFDTTDDSKDFYQGLLHISVGLYHLTNKNNQLGMKLQFEKAFKRLMKYPNVYNDINLGELLSKTNDINKNPGSFKLSGLPLIRI
jgi:uncharacterized protein